MTTCQGLLRGSWKLLRGFFVICAAAQPRSLEETLSTGSRVENAGVD